MSYLTARKAITDRLKTYTGAPALYAENQPAPPADTTQAVPWARWSIRPSTSLDSTVGGTRQRTLGIVFFQLFIPEDKGTMAADTFADKVSALLNAKRLPSGPYGVVVFERAQLKYVSRRGDGYAQHNVTVAYREDNVAVNAA